MSTETEQGVTPAPAGLAPAEPRTFLPARAGRPARPPQPRQVGVLRAGGALSVVGALAAALCTSGLLWTQIGFFSGIFGFIVVTWLLFVGLYAALASMEASGPAMRDKIAAVVVQSLGAVVVI